MDVKEIVKIAINHVNELFAAENPTNIGLEEIVFDDSDKTWNVTIGFSRPWDYQKPSVINGFQSQQALRQYKVVNIRDKDGKVNAIKIRE